MHTSRLQSTAQISLSGIYTVGYFAVLASFIAGWIKTPLEFRDVLSALLGLLTAGEMLILQFWFSRERPKESPPPEGMQ